MDDQELWAKIIAKLKEPEVKKERTSRPNRRKPTDARTCECWATVFASTSLFWVAIVDAEDGWLLRDYKWSASGGALDRPFYPISPRYSRETGNSNRLHQAITGNIHFQLDHINGNGHDCRKVNLRPCTQAENRRNSGRQSNNKASKYKGVSKEKDGATWVARIKIDEKQKYLGSFGFESDAAICYNYHAAYLHGEFAKLNRIPPEEYMHD